VPYDALGSSPQVGAGLGGAGSGVNVTGSRQPAARGVSFPLRAGDRDDGRAERRRPWGSRVDVRVLAQRRPAPLSPGRLRLLLPPRPARSTAHRRSRPQRRATGDGANAHVPFCRHRTTPARIGTDTGRTRSHAEPHGEGAFASRSTGPTEAIAGRLPSLPKGYA